MIRTLRHLVLLLAVISTTTHAGPRTLKLGVYPYVSASKLIKHQTPVHQFLRKQLNHDIEFVTAQDFSSYAAHVQNADYDLIFAPSHFARYCEKEGLYTPLALTQTKIQGVYLVNKESSLQTLEDLRGQALSISTVGLRFGLLHQIMKQQTKALAIDKLKYVEARTNNNSIFSVLKKDIDVALTGINIWKNINPAARSQLRVIGETPRVPGFVIMAKPSLGKQIKALFAHVDRDFSASLAGKKYIFRGLKPYAGNMLQDMDPYTTPFDQVKH